MTATVDTAADATTAESVDLEGLTKAQLLQYAEQYGIDGVSSSQTKAEIKSIILDALG